MPSPVSKNVAAALGLVPTVVDGVRRLPAKAVQLPVMAVGSALAGLDAARREYDDLAERGERLIARLRGTSFDELEDKVEDTLSGTPVAKLYDRAEDALEEVTKRVVHAVQDTLPVAETLAPTTPARIVPARIDTAAAPDVVEQVEQIAAEVAAPLITDHSALPLPDYDHMTLGSLRGRLRSLDLQQLVQLRDYEKSKGDRLPVVTMLDNRIAKLANGESAPTGAVPPEPVETATAKPQKKVGATAAAKIAGPPHTKVRTT